MRRDVPRSRMCTQEELTSPSFQRWATTLREPHMGLHRKLWEWCFIVEILERDEMLIPGKKGLGFAVGHEPLAAHFASRGVQVIASDVDVKRAEDSGWVASYEHASSLEKLNDRGICPAREFARLVEFRTIDMLDFDPKELSAFDFVWSSCAFEHLGSLEAGLRYVAESVKCLKPGGLAVHTTEFNVSSNDETVSEGGTVIYRERDLEGLAADLRSQGHFISLDFNRGTHPADYFVDVPPYVQDTHLKLHLMGHTTTSIGIVVRRGG